MYYKVFCLVLIIFTLTAVSYAQTKPLTNDDIVQMTTAGFAEQTIVKAIQAHETGFDTSVGALVALKNAGVTKVVIEAMLDGGAKTTKPTPQTLLPPGDEAAKSNPSATPAASQNQSNSDWPAELAGMYREVGIYYKQDGKFLQLYGKPVVATNTGGFLKSSLTMGLSKIRSKGEVPGKHAQLQVPTRQPTFYFYMPEGQIPDDFVVVKMADKGNRREFQVGSFGGAAGGMNSGLDLDKVSQVIIERAAPHVYRLTPDRELGDGEYGFLGSFVILTAGMAGGGEKVYDFGVHMKKK